MSYTIRSDHKVNLVLNQQDTASSVVQNIGVLLSTWQGECPVFRDFGIDPDILHRPLNVARIALQADIIEAINKYEPRANVLDVSFETSSEYPDRLVSIVEVEVDEEDGA